MRTSVYIATSLDGFIAREDGSLDWLDAANTKIPEGEDCGYHSFMKSIDVLIMGRHTFEKVLSFGDWPYTKPVVVLSRNILEIPEPLKKTVMHFSETPEELYQRLSKDGYKHLYIDGGITIQRFLAAGLIDDITITVIPIILGRGKPLFSNLERDIELRHISTKQYDFGFVQSSYQLIH